MHLQYTCFIVVIIALAFVRIGDGTWPSGFVGGFFRPRSNSALARPRMVRVFQPNCTGVTCSMMEAKCQMMRIVPCSGGGNCSAPFCVSSPELPRVVSAVDNFGVCPLSESTVSTNGGVFCSNDTACEINQKCCVNGPRIECVNVTSVTIATFMAMRQLSLQRFFPSRTQGRQSPMVVGEGYCAVVNPTAFAETCANGQLSCTMDSDCPGRQKCCVAGCGKLCINPVSIFTAKTGNKKPGSAAAARNASSTNMASKRGVCPTIAIDAVLGNVTACFASDMECSGSRKCCAIPQGGLGCIDGFGFIALPSPLSVSRSMSRRSGSPSLARIRGTCPAFSNEIGIPCAMACANDTTCQPSGMLCCPLGGCMECLNPVISSTFLAIRPGMCPSFSPNVTSSCVDECQEDNDCVNPTWKCCAMGCGKSCMNPVASSTPMIKAGTCPAASNVTSSSSPMRAFHGGRSKRYGGGTFFSSGRRFFTPRRQSASGCTFLRFNSCLTDASCAQSQKCCMNRCGGMSCTSPA